MECPFCKKDINESAIFCPNCGQLLENNLRFQSVDNYWDDINTKTKKEIENHEREIYEKKKSKRKVRAKKFFKVFFVCLVILILSCTVYVLIKNHNTKNANKLNHINESMIGHTYSETSLGAFSVGESLDRRIVTIIDNDSLTFLEGNYRSYLDDQNKLNWNENEIYQNETYSYELSISFFGKVNIYINGKEYEVNIDDDDSVSSIDLY